MTPQPSTENLPETRCPTPFDMGLAAGRQDWRTEAVAPSNVRILTWGKGGHRFMMKDDRGQWRNMMGAPKNAPTHWMPLPQPPVSD